MIVKCEAGHENRIPEDAPPAKYRCGRCKKPLEIVWASDGPGRAAENKVGSGSRERVFTDRQPVSMIPAVLSIAFLVLAVLAKWPSGFYTLLRFAVCGSSAYLAWGLGMLNKRLWLWVMGASAALFNPLIPVRLDRSVWQVIDFVAAIVFAVSLLSIRRMCKTSA